MKGSRSFSPLLFIIFFLILCCAHSGCGRSVERIAVKNEVSLPKASMTGAVKIAKQNLSMANKLKQIPSSDYVLGPEDLMEISVFRHDELKLQCRVSQTGMISYYLVGDIRAAGLTEFQLRDKLQEELARFIKDPKLVVRITEAESHKIFVLGQVKNPGVYRMRKDYTLVEAISAAGGMTPNAYLGGAYVVRDGKILVVNFVELIEKGNTEENIPLLLGDTIYIPDNRDHKVFVLGEVNKQAAVPMRDKMTLLEAIAEAGGLTRDAKKNAILIMRGNLSEPEIMTIDGERMDIVAGIPLQPGDIVFVANSGFANVERIAVRLSHILEPFYTLARTVVWGAAARDVLRGGETKFVVVD
jgi:polysaccharide export outer membrane protein